MDTPFPQQEQDKIYKSYILILPQPQGHVMWVRCEQSFRLTYNWSMVTVSQILHFTCKQDEITDKGKDRQTHDTISRCPRLTFQARDIKS